MPTTNVQDLETRVEELEAEEERIAGQLAEAQRSARAAEQRLHAIDERTAAIAARSFGGDEEAQQEVEDLEEEAVRLTRSLKVARAAAEDFERMLREAKTRASKARTDIYRQRYNALYSEARALDDERAELARQLVEVLEKQSSLTNDASQELRYYDQDGANSVAMGVRPAVQDFIDRTFYRWLH